MNKKTLRNLLALAAAAVSASLEAPQLAHSSLAQATAELADAPEAISGAVKRTVANVTASHLGFDTNVYPGDDAMRAWKRDGAYEWVGYYLQAPCHKDDSWSGRRQHLVDNGWGLAVIYVGQQAWGKHLGASRNTTSAKAKSSRRSKSRHHSSPRTMTRKSAKPVATKSDRCSASYVGAAQGQLDARDAIAKSQREGFPRATVIFLDVEHMNSIPQPMRDYYRAWTQMVLTDGRYRPGIYAHTKNASKIYDDVSDVYAASGIDADPPFWVAGARGFSPDSSAPTDVGHEFASVWQGMLDVVRTHNGVRLPIDISVASAASPSLEE
ncbi:MAG TPA: glycoside hydrolase domain-containing protein [Gemmatimonadaceae bacterium]|nr:glycoside hydrolase domain-containing protein [Gemmatimonadaceae bacterium]